MGLAYTETGNYDKDLKIGIEYFGEDNERIIKLYSNLGLLLKKREEYAIALDYFENAVDIIDELGLDLDLDHIALYNNIALAYKEMLIYSKALEYYEKAMKGSIDIYREDHINTALIYKNLLTVYLGQGNYVATIFFLERSLIIFLKSTLFNKIKETENIANITKSLLKLYKILEAD